MSGFIIKYLKFINKYVGWFFKNMIKIGEGKKKIYTRIYYF